MRGVLLLLKVGGQAFARLMELAFADDVVPIKDAARLVPEECHRDAFRDAGSHQIPGGRSSAIVQIPAGEIRGAAGSRPRDFPAALGRVRGIRASSRPRSRRYERSGSC